MSARTSLKRPNKPSEKLQTASAKPVRMTCYNSGISP